MENIINSSDKKESKLDFMVNRTASLMDHINKNLALKIFADCLIENIEYLTCESCNECKTVTVQDAYSKLKEETI